MGVISCPDCNQVVSDVAESCTKCGRPWPAKSKDQLAAEKAGSSLSSCFGLFLILWGVNAFLALVSKGLVGFVMALMMGPLIWIVR